MILTEYNTVACGGSNVSDTVSSVVLLTFSPSIIEQVYPSHVISSLLLACGPVCIISIHLVLDRVDRADVV